MLLLVLWDVGLGMWGGRLLEVSKLMHLCGGVGPGKIDTHGGHVRNVSSTNDLKPLSNCVSDHCH